MSAPPTPFVPKFRHKYRVDSVPWWWWPLYWTYGWGLGILYAAYLVGVRLTSRIVWTGEKSWLRPPSIHAWWHRFGNPYFLVFMPLTDHVFMSHPYWYMAPTHNIFRIFGIRKIYLGSTGNAGKEAATQVAAELKAGACTVMTPDGPDGPSGEIRKGIFYMARQSGAPIVPVRFEVRGAFSLGGWDRKLIPLPFSRIRVFLGQPILVSEDEFDQYVPILREGLGPL